jgi:regulator of sirC expression with transglutaminase-like and TPR domain
MDNLLLFSKWLRNLENPSNTENLDFSELSELLKESHCFVERNKIKSLKKTDIEKIYSEVKNALEKFLGKFSEAEKEEFYNYIEQTLDYR